MFIDDLVNFPVPGARNPGKLELQFWQFHSDNPVVYRLLVRFAREWRALGNEHGSMQLLCERMRWEFATSVRSTDGFKLNNNHVAFYSRLLEDQEPELEGFFRKRQQRVQCTFGPLNATLPPGGHIA
jgi:hypothetical protein